MSNSQVNLLRKQVGKDGRIVHLPVDGGAHIYEGTMVSQLTATGMLCPTSTANAGACIGVATHESDNSAGGASDGDKRCAVETDRVFIFANASDSGDECSEATLFGDPVYAYDDHTVQDNDEGGTLKRAGFFMGMEPDGNVRVYIPPTLAFAQATASDVGALTYAAVAGTATNDTLEALPDPTDTPADADALRDDIVATLLPPLRNNFRDVASQINEIRAALQAAGLMA